MDRSPALLLDAAVHGDQEAWNQIVERYSRLVWSVARGYRLSLSDTADVAQTTWLRLIENLDRIRDPDQLAGWLATTARREALRVLRQAGRVTPIDDEDLIDVADVEQESPETAMFQAAAVDEIHDRLEMLPGRQREVMKLRAAGLSVEQTAARLGVSTASIRALQARARQSLVGRFEWNRR